MNSFGVRSLLRKEFRRKEDRLFFEVQSTNVWKPFVRYKANQMMQSIAHQHKRFKGLMGNTQLKQNVKALTVAPQITKLETPWKTPLEAILQLVDKVTDMLAGAPEEQNETFQSKGKPSATYKDTNKKAKTKKTDKYKVPTKEERDVFRLSVRNLLFSPGRWTFAKYRAYHQVSIIEHYL